MIGNIITKEFYNTIPKTWNGIIGYNYRTTEEHYNNGWRDVVSPSYNTATQRLGDRYFDEVNDQYTYEIIEKTVEEIQAEKVSESNALKEEKIATILKEKILSEAEDFTDEDALTNPELYPFWEAGVFVESGKRYQHFNSDNELKLYECITSHTTQEDWKPKDTPALFKVVALADEVPVWVQPLGSHDAYQTGDRVHYPTLADSIYISVVDNNIWNPTVYGWELED